MSRRRLADLPPGLDKELDRVLDEAVERRLKPLQSHIQRLESDADTQGRQLAFLQIKAGIRVEHAEDGDRGAGLTPDTTWPCKKCGRRLGYYDGNTDVMRSAKGTHQLWIHVGPGGWIKTICPGCCEENWVHDTPKGDGRHLEAIGGEVILDVPLLQSLLDQAVVSEHGHVRLAVVESDD